jgi:hypothetical protein
MIGIGLFILAARGGAITVRSAAVAAAPAAAQHTLLLSL